MAKKLSRLSEAILEMAGDQYRSGLMEKAGYEKITVRLLGAQPLPTAKPISSSEIRRIREKANMSQAAFARSLNLSVGYISQLERGTKQLKGPALASVIRLNPAICDRVKSGHRESGRRRDCFTLPTCSFARRGVAR